MQTLLNQLLVTRWAIVIWSLTALSCSALWALELPQSIINTVRDILPLQVQLKMLATLIMLSAALLLSLLFTRKDQSLIPRYGVYWDKMGNSYCPSCKALTSQIYWVSHDNKQWHGLHCSGCNKTFLTIDAGVPMHVQDAMKRMAKR